MHGGGACCAWRRCPRCAAVVAAAPRFVWRRGQRAEALGFLEVLDVLEVLEVLGRLGCLGAWGFALCGGCVTSRGRHGLLCVAVVALAVGALLLSVVCGGFGGGGGSPPVRLAARAEGRGFGFSRGARGSRGSRASLCAAVCLFSWRCGSSLGGCGGFGGGCRLF